MKDWIYDFDKTANRLLDAINFIDNQQNNNMLIENGLIDVNITNEREKLLKMLRAADASRFSRGRIEKSLHFSMFNTNTSKEESINWVLSKYNNICLVLKNITLTLEIPWLYNQC